MATTLPQVARARREVLTTTANPAAKATQCVQRTSPVGGVTFSQTVAFGLLGHPQASLEEWTPTAATLGVLIPLQAAPLSFASAVPQAARRGPWNRPCALPILCLCGLSCLAPWPTASCLPEEEVAEACRLGKHLRQRRETGVKRTRIRLRPSKTFEYFGRNEFEHQG